MSDTAIASPICSLRTDIACFASAPAILIFDPDFVSEGIGEIKSGSTTTSTLESARFSRN